MKTDKYNNIMTNIEDKLDQYNFANLFNVVQLGEKSYFNICKTIQFDNIDYIPQSYIDYYIVKEGDTWTLISYKFYGTIKLWWLICKVNNIQDPFMDLQIGMSLKILKKEIVDEILKLLHK
jgi:nucleoid-associated protein YgaU